MEKLKRIKQLIIDFEQGIISCERAVKEINIYSTTEVDREWLNSYHSSLSLDDFVKLLTIESISDWELINDNRALVLLNEAIESIDNEALLNRNFEALEKRYSKPEGSIFDWVFQDGIMNSKELLNRLKKNTMIIL